MKVVPIILIPLCLVLAACSPSAPEQVAPETDTSNYSDMLVGDWKQRHNETKGPATFVFESDLAFRSDGTEQAVGTMVLSGSGLSATLSYDQTGTWKIDGDLLTISFVSSDFSELQGSKEFFDFLGSIQAGMEQQDGKEVTYIIKKLTEKKIVAIDSEGNERTFYRQ